MLRYFSLERNGAFDIRGPDILLLRQVFTCKGLPNRLSPVVQTVIKGEVNMLCYFAR